jgi:hypothetical protein
MAIVHIFEVISDKFNIDSAHNFFPKRKQQQQQQQQQQ